MSFYLIICYITINVKSEKEKIVKKFSNMNELAEHLGLSRSTVSYILNDKWRERNISEKTAARVLECAAKHQFSPNFLGLAINGKVSIDVAILLSRGMYEHHRQAFFEFLDFVEGNNLKYMVFQLGEQEENFAVLERLRNFRVSHAWLLAPQLLGSPGGFDWWRRAAAGNPGIEFLFYDYRYQLEPAGFQWPDNVYTTGFNAEKAFRDIFNYIREGGYRELSIFGMGGEYLIPLARQAGMEIQIHNPGPVVGELTDYGRNIGRILAAEPRRNFPRAVFISDDLGTIGAVAELLEQGFQVPRDFAFISWDGLKISRYFQKSVTTLEVPHPQMLAFAAAFATGNPPGRHLEVHPSIRPGETMPQP